MEGSITFLPLPALLVAQKNKGKNLQRMKDLPSLCNGKSRISDKVTAFALPYSSWQSSTRKKKSYLFAKLMGRVMVLKSWAQVWEEK